MKMLAMRRESDQMFGSATNVINDNTINGTNDGVDDGCCNNTNYHDGEYLWRCFFFSSWRRSTKKKCLHHYLECFLL